MILKQKSHAEFLNGNQAQWLPFESLAWTFIDISFVFQANEGSPQPESANESTSHLNGAACRQENGFYPEKHSVPSRTIRTWRERVFLFRLNLFSICFWDEECNSASTRICWSFVLIPTSFIRSLKYIFRYRRIVPCGLKAMCDRRGKWHSNTCCWLQAWHR